MKSIPVELIRAYRNRTFHVEPGSPLRTPEDAVAFVKERGFIHFWPISGVLLPSLWVAVAGDRPVADEHDDPGHVSWDWKDTLLGSDRWYYAKVLRKKATMISFDAVSCFYALSENYGSPEEDYLTLYEQGRLTLEAKTIYEAILDEGPIDSVALRRTARMSSPSSESRFNRALSDLQADFKILPVEVTRAGAWHYAFAYDIVDRHYPNIPEQARTIREDDARQKLAELYFLSVGAATEHDVAKLFGWRIQEVGRAVEALTHKGVLQRDLKLA